MNIAIDSGPLSSAHSIRGIGMYTKMLTGSLGISPIDIAHGDLSKFDIVHITSFKPYELSIPISKPKKTKFILTIYDLIPLIYPKHYPPGLKGRLNLMFNRLLIHKNVDHIITISETSKKDICRFFDIKPDKISVIYLGPTLENKKNDKKHIENIKKKFNLPDNFALYVGDINFNKNIPILVEACRKARMPLVIAGKQAAEMEKMDLNHPELVHLKNVDWSNVIRLGYVDSLTLASIYKLASVYVQPSLYEGFGLPVLDAFLLGVPVVASRTQALVEIAQDAALYAKPNDVKDFSNKIIKCMDKKTKENLVVLGVRRAKEFSWSKNAMETLKIYEEV